MLSTYFVRVLLSLLILLSVLPLDAFADIDGLEFLRGRQGIFDWWFLGIFGLEFLVRLAVFVRHVRAGQATFGETVLLVLDLIAVLSFLPLQRMFGFRYVRLIRLVRLVLLLGYWGDMMRDLWRILMSRERRFQVAFVLVTGFLLSLAAAVVLHAVLGEAPGPDGFPSDFLGRFWWSFMQVEDPGNLWREPNHIWVVGVSVALTLAGLLLFSFLVGIGTSAIEELMIRSRTRPVQSRDHTVILGLGEHSHFLLAEFAGIYRKNLRAFRGAVLGPTERPPDSVADAIDAFSYRHGDPVRAEDLDRVAVSRAKRVVILGTQPGDPDAAVVAAILATRDRNPRVHLYADLEHESSLDAARSAGGARTHVIGSGSFVGNYIAQNMANAGIYRLYRQLLTSDGCEIYSYVFDSAERARFLGSGAAGTSLDLSALHDRAARDHNVWMLGVFIAPPGDPDAEFDDLRVLLAPTPDSVPPDMVDDAGRMRADAVRGVIGVSLRWNDVRDFGRSFVAHPHSAPAGDAQAFDGLELVPSGHDVRRVLVLGDSRRIPRVLTDVTVFYGDVGFDVLVRDESRVPVLLRDVRSAFTRSLPGVTFEESSTADHTLLEVRSESGSARVRVAVADWSDSTRLVHDPVINLATVDVVLFLPRTRGADALDGVVALECLQLARLEASGQLPYPPHTRVLAMIQDPVKGDLLERRLDEMTGGPGRERFTIVSSERVRHHFIVQNVFVRGLNAVFRELFDPAGPSIRRMEPRKAGPGALAGDFDPHVLARHLLVERGCAFLGVELDPIPGGGQGPGRGQEPEIILDPRELPRGRRLSWARVRALYVVGRVPR